MSAQIKVKKKMLVKKMQMRLRLIKMLMRLVKLTKMKLTRLVKLTRTKLARLVKLTRTLTKQILTKTLMRVEMLHKNQSKKEMKRKRKLTVMMKIFPKKNKPNVPQLLLPKTTHQNQVKVVAVAKKSLVSMNSNAAEMPVTNSEECLKEFAETEP